MSWNTRDLLDRCLASMRADADAGRAEVWVVDNASDDGSADMVAERHPWVTLIASQENLGFGPAVNLVADRTKTAWVAPANADVELSPGALEALLAAGARHPEAGLVAPRLVLPDGTTQHSVYAFPTVPFTALFNLGLHQLPRIGRRLGDRLCLEGYWNSERGRAVDWAIAAFVIVRRQAWDEIGGFDPDQWMYAEDLDIGWRLSRAGWAARYVPDARVRHHSSAATTQMWGEDRVDRWLASTYAWLLRRRGWARMRATAALNVAGAGFRAAWYAALGRLAPARWAGRREFFAQWSARHRRAGLASRARLRAHR